MNPRALQIFVSVFALAGAAACAAANAAAALAADDDRTAATRDQLRACLEGDDALKARADQLKATETSMKVRSAGIEAESAKVLELQGQLDHHDQTAIDSFNKAVDEHNAHVNAFNQATEDEKAATDAFNRDTKAYNEQCGRLHYRIDDWNAVKKERAAVGKRVWDNS